MSYPLAFLPQYLSVFDSLSLSNLSSSQAVYFCIFQCFFIFNRHQGHAIWCRFNENNSDHFVNVTRSKLDVNSLTFPLWADTKLHVHVVHTCLCLLSKIQQHFHFKNVVVASISRPFSNYLCCLCLFIFSSFLRLSL